MLSIKLSQERDHRDHVVSAVAGVRYTEEFGKCSMVDVRMCGYAGFVKIG